MALSKQVSIYRMASCFPNTPRLPRIKRVEGKHEAEVDITSLAEVASKRDLIDRRHGYAKGTLEARQ